MISGSAASVLELVQTPLHSPQTSTWFPPKLWRWRKRHHPFRLCSGFRRNSDQPGQHYNGGGLTPSLLDLFSGASATIKGKGGKDIITIGDKSELQASSQILGNAGADSITIDGIFIDSNVTVGGGSGNDTITLTATGLPRS